MSYNPGMLVISNLSNLLLTPRSPVNKIRLIKHISITYYLYTLEV